MIRFHEFESLGLTLAAMSDKSDGDCALARGAEGIQAFCSACGVVPDQLIRLRQIHGTRVVEAGKPAANLVEADGLTTREPGLAIGVGVADCVPVFLFDPAVRCAAAVHAGRIGTQGGIAILAVEELVRLYGARPDRIHALIGPSAGPCCYEVSGEMAEIFSHSGLPARGRYLNLWAANSQQLALAGVPESHVRISGICTICDGRFYSHRADVSPGRNLAVLMI